MKKHLITLLCFALSVIGLSAQQKNMTKKEKTILFELISAQILESYVDEDIAKEVAEILTSAEIAHKYKGITAPKEVAKKLTKELQNLSHDLHIKVNYEPKKIAQRKRGMPEEIKQKRAKMMALQMASINYGFKEVSVLEGNIGYINLGLFSSMEEGKEVAAAAMNFLQHTNAMIIDLRNNGGGVPGMVQLLASYFTGEQPVVLSHFYERRTGNKTQLTTLKTIDGKRYANKPLYILTNKKTFSAAEAFAYALKHLDKAIIVGEPTKGGANRTKRMTLNDAFSISVPYIQAIHPITKTNWEGKGVQPNINTKAKRALVRAHIAAIVKTTKRNSNRTLNKIGYSYLQNNQVDDAISVFQENVKLHPTSANAWDSLGEAYLNKKDVENALKSYQKALALDPGASSAKAMIQQLKTIK